MGTVIKLIRDRTKLGLLSSFSTGTTPLFLDLFPNAAAAYSLRKLRTAYSGSAIRVRRSSDNAVLDIGFVDNVLDTASLLTFCGGGDGFVTISYDQSLNGINQTQTSASDQPRIVSLGSLEIENTKPIIKAQPGSFMEMPINPVDRYYMFMVTLIDGNGTLISSSPSQWGLYSESGSTSTATSSPFITYNSFFRNGSSYTPVTRGSLFNDFSTQSLSYIDFSINFDVGVKWGYNGTASFRMYSYQDLIIYDTDQSSNRAAIESNINNYYAVY